MSSHLSFDEDVPSRKIPSRDKSERLLRCIMNISGGTVRDEKTASYIIFGIVIITFAIMFYILVYSGKSGGEIEVPPGYKLAPPSADFSVLEPI